MNSNCSKEIINRLASIEGHIKGIKQMVIEDKPCEDVLWQMYAVESAMSKAAKLLFKNHLNTCIKESVEKGDYSVLDKLTKLLDKYM